jgi:hypothetical protein
VHELIEKARNKLIDDNRPASGGMGNILDFHLYVSCFCLEAIDRQWPSVTGASTVVTAVHIAGA